MYKALMTGATGPVGIALARLLVAEGGSVCALVRRESRRLATLKGLVGVQVVECGLDGLAGLSSTMVGGYEVFFHLGWAGTDSRETRNDASQQARNIAYTLDAVRLAQKAGCRAFVGAGSHAECGPSQEKISGSTPIRPFESYGVAKFAAGQLSRHLCEELNMRHCWTRILSVFGPFDRETTLIMYCIRSLLEGGTPILTKGEQVWDYIYSLDCARALYSIGERGKHGAVYPLGSGETRTLAEYVGCLRDCINPAMALGFGKREYPPGQLMHLSADVSEVRMDTGFTPEWSFERGIEATVKWARETRSR